MKQARRVQIYLLLVLITILTFSGCDDAGIQTQTSQETSTPIEETPTPAVTEIPIEESNTTTPATVSETPSIEETEIPATADISKPGIKLTQRHIGSYPAETLSHDYVISPDGRRIAFIAQEKGETLRFVNTDGNEGKRYEYIENLKFSPDSTRLAYTADTGTNWVVVIDDNETVIEDGFVENIIFSPDSNRYAYLVCNGEQWYVVIDGQKGKLYDGIIVTGFSPDSQRFAYVACENGEYFAVIDEIEGNRYDRTSAIEFSAGSQSYVYTALIEDKEMIVVNGVEGKLYEYIDYWVFSPQGNRLAYEAEEDEESFMVIDGVEGKRYEYLSWSFTFSPDGTRFAYAGYDGTAWRIIVDGVESAETYEDSPLQMIFSPDNQRLAFIISAWPNSYAVVDGMKGQEYDSVYNLAFSPDSLRFAYVAKLGSGGGNTRYTVVEDGEEGPFYDYMNAISAYDDFLVFSPDSQRLAYPAEKFNRYCMVIDGIDTGSFNYVGAPVFSPDSRIVAFTSNRESTMNINDIKISDYDWVSGITFDDDNNFYFFAEEENNKKGIGLMVNIYLVEGKVL